jgi:hypothetical protein
MTKKMIFMITFFFNEYQNVNISQMKKNPQTVHRVASIFLLVATPKYSEPPQGVNDLPK